MVVINKEVLTPARSEAKANSDEGKADHHVPGTDIWNRVLGLGYVEGHDPDQANHEVGDHCGGEPAWALQILRGCLMSH